MTAFTIEVKSDAVQAVLKKLASRAGGLRPVLDNIGTKILERTERRFDTSIGPDGVKWEKNSDVTLALLAGRIAGKKSKVKKDGSLNAAGQRAYANKKPLIGESGKLGGLRGQFKTVATETSLTVSNTMAYAAIQQFGGILGPTTWFPGKKIPARPFLPVHQDGTLYPAEQTEVLAALNHFLMEGL
jgi:phage gpG-like protein